VSAVVELIRSPEVLARKNGPCPECDEQIVAGETYVAKVDGCKKGWMHATCAAAYIRHREAFEELNRDITEDPNGGSEES
jgi:hypothetical protein